MRKTAPASILACLLLAAVSLPLAASGSAVPETTRRLALVIGANYGGPGRARLRYAVSDARAMIQVLESLGGVLPDDCRLLLEPGRETLLGEAARLRERISRLRPLENRLEVFVYYSGHADADHLLLGREKVSYRELRGLLQDLAVDVRIAVLDSCASGAFIRAKGGRMRPPFLIDTAYDMKGFAVMTSSSADEASQESERIRGSFFTRALITGLRGAADASRDGRVTLSEAYQYAFGETLRQTETAAGGPQHPSYDIQLSGTGDVVITDLRQGDALLRLGRDIAGRVFVHDSADTLLMEFPKTAGAALELGVSRGRYRIVVVSDSDVREADVELAGGANPELGADRFTRTEILDAIARGDQAVQRQAWPAGTKAARFHAGFFSRLSRYEGHWSFMPGMQLGIRVRPSLTFGLVGFGQTSAEVFRRPPFWGLAVDYLLVEKGRLGLRLRTVAGFMYQSREDELAKRLSTVIEPGACLAWKVSGLLRIVALASLDFVDGANDSLRRFSCGLGLELCKQ